MVRGKRIRFYATKGDLLGILHVVEQEIPLEYIRMGWYETDDFQCIESYSSVDALPHVGFGENDYYIENQIYMICPKGMELRFRKIIMHKTQKERYMLDTLANPDTVLYYTGGISLTTPNILIFAEINTLGGYPFCEKLFRIIKKEIKRKSKCYDDMYFCSGAIEFQRKGGRLVYDIAKRAEYDIPSLDEVGVGVSDGKISDLDR